MISVMIVTNHPIMREGLRLRVQQELDMHVVSEASDLPQILRDFIAFKPDVTLIDLQLPRGAALKAMSAIRALSPAAPLVALMSYPGEFDMLPRTGQGRILVVSKTSPSEEIVLAMRQALEP
jgi:DNA-binding NarL/FixJ family response regulator